MKKNILAIAFLVFGVFTNAQSSKDVKIAELLETMGSTEAMKTSFEYMINYYKQNNPQISSQYWDNSLKHVDYNELVQKLVPVYSKHFCLNTSFGTDPFFSIIYSIIFENYQFLVTKKAQSKK